LYNLCTTQTSPKTLLRITRGVGRVVSLDNLLKVLDLTEKNRPRLLVNKQLARKTFLLRKAFLLFLEKTVVCLPRKLNNFCSKNSYGYYLYRNLTEKYQNSRDRPKTNAFCTKVLLLRKLQQESVKIRL